LQLAWRIQEVGDVVFCFSLTFVAGANPILYQEATPVLIDSETETWNMSPEALERALQDVKKNGKLPKAVIVVNLYDQSAKMDELVSTCDSYGSGCLSLPEFCRKFD
jgi:pyridoxal phosphate-dependent aminotransferase EpsN